VCDQVLQEDLEAPLPRLQEVCLVVVLEPALGRQTEAEAWKHLLQLRPKNRKYTVSGYSTHCGTRCVGELFHTLWYKMCRRPILHIVIQKCLLFYDIGFQRQSLTLSETRVRDEILYRGHIIPPGVNGISHYKPF
jgi:hypothetical protein